MPSPEGKQTRRPRSAHPGVVLISPKSGHRQTWRARYQDADTGKVVYARLDPQAYPNARARRDWAVRTSQALAKRRAELEAGAPRFTGSTLETEIERYFKDHAHLRPKTLQGYRAAADKLVSWAKADGVDDADRLDRSHLLAFRASLIREPKHAPVPGGVRGRPKPMATRRSPHSINRELRAAATILTYLRKARRLPRIVQEDITEGLERLRTPRAPIQFLRGPSIQSLIEAALAHDEASFRETRAEHRGEKPRGSTTRYSPIAPAVFGALTTGMRLGELVAVTWRDVDLEAVGDEGAPVGEIRLRPELTKTHQGRIVDLSVSPALRALLALRRPKDGKDDLDLPVFGITYDEAHAAQKRLVKRFGAPSDFTWQALRRTAGTYLTNAPGLFGAASAYRSARQLGHSVTVAEKNYVGVVRGIPHDAKSLEQAMGITAVVRSVLDAERRRQGLPVLHLVS